MSIIIPNALRAAAFVQQTPAPLMFIQQGFGLITRTAPGTYDCTLDEPVSLDQGIPLASAIVNGSSISVAVSLDLTNPRNIIVETRLAGVLDNTISFYLLLFEVPTP